MKRIISLVLVSFVLSGCAPAMKVAKPDSQTGYIESKDRPVGTATIVKNTKLPLAQYKSMVFFTATPYQYDFGFNQLKEVGYFDQVAKYSDLEKIVIANNLQDKIVSLDSQIGLSRLAKYYKPFLWVTLSVDYKDGGKAKLLVRNAENAEEVFEATTSMKEGSTDETVWYPLFNALIKWINENK